MRKKINKKIELNVVLYKFQLAIVEKKVKILKLHVNMISYQNDQRDFIKRLD